MGAAGVYSMLLAFLLTQALECGLSLPWRSRWLTYCVFLCNLLTNPLLNLLLLLYYKFFGLTGYWPLCAALEIAVVFLEAWVIKLMTGYRCQKAFLLSLLFNACSFGIGLLLQVFHIW